MKTQEEYKKTPIGRVPEGWEVARLGEIFNVYGGTTPPTSKKEYWNGDITWVTPTDMTKLAKGNHIEMSERMITSKAVEASSLKLLKPNTLLLTSRATVGFTALNVRPLTINQGMTALSPKHEDQTDALFYAYYLRHLKPFLEQLGAGSTFKEVSRSSIGRLKVFYPGLKEQKKIAAILSTVDEAIGKVDEAIAKTQRLKKGLMQELLTKGIGHREFKNTEIGRIPKDWDVAELASLISELKNGFASGKRDENGIVQIRMNNITTDGRLILDSYLKVPRPDQINNLLLGANDLLFNNTNSIDLVGKSALFKQAPFPCTFSNHFTRFRFREIVLPDWVLNIFIVLWQKGFFKSVAIRHVGQAAVHKSHLLKLKIPLPSPPEQRQIATILSTVDKRLEFLRERRQKLNRIKKALMNDLLTGRKRVKVEA